MTDAERAREVARTVVRAFEQKLYVGARVRHKNFPAEGWVTKVVHHDAVPLRGFREYDSANVEWDDDFSGWNTKAHWADRDAPFGDDVLVVIS